MTNPPQQPIGELVDDLFRRSAGRMLAALTRALGPAHMDLAEDVVQGALIKALELWPYSGIPDDPEAWLFRVARNAALDHVRRSSTFQSKVVKVSDVGTTDVCASGVTVIVTVSVGSDVSLTV